MEIGTQTGPYRTDALLGKGGMAEVFKVWNGNLQRFEALKALPPALAHDRSLVERFLREARTAAGLQHPNIAAVYGVSQSNATQPFFTMELISGGDLADLIAQRGRFTLDEALPILRQIASALDYAGARGLIHRDIKPANIMMNADGNEIKVVDFGIARAHEESGGTRMTQAGMIVGTPEYMSPEQAGSGAPVDARTDQYSLGVIAYEMLCGEPPFVAQRDTSILMVMMQHVNDAPRPPLEWTPDLPRNVNAAILRALAKDPAQRFASCSEFVSALQSPASALRSPYAPATESARAPKRAFPVVPVALGLVVLAGVGLIGLGANRHDDIVEVVPGAVAPLPNSDGASAPVAVASEPKPATKSEPDPTDIPVAPSSLVGTWRGTWPWIKQDVPASLVITSQDGDSFDGVLTLSFRRGRSQIKLDGLVQDGGTVELRETEIVSQYEDWGELSTSSGYLASDRKRIYGEFNPTKKWSFRWTNSATDVPSSY